MSKQATRRDWLQLHAATASLTPDRIGKAGRLLEWLEDWGMEAPELQHRHVSQLYAPYPSEQITPDDTTGRGIGWRINLWAPLQKGECAYSTRQRLLPPSRSDANLFDTHPPFQIDGNFGAAAGKLPIKIAAGQTLRFERRDGQLQRMENFA